MTDSSNQDPFTNQSGSDFPEELCSIFQRNQLPLKVHTYLYPIDESEEFHDPFSDLSLFLAKRVKKEILKEPDSKNWSKAIQNAILQEILPDFKRKFPKYRLGSNALKTTFEKVNHYLKFARGQQNAFRSDGKLNTHLMIRENLRDLYSESSKTLDHPYQSAHKLAVKISECIATLDGERPKIDELTQLIWAVQKHLLPKLPTERCPFESYGELDKLIVRRQLEILAKEPELSQSELAKKIERSILEIKQLSRIKNLHDLAPHLSSLLAEKLYPTLPIHNSLSSDKLSKIKGFIRSEIQKNFDHKQHLESSDYLWLVRRILFVYQLSLELTKERAEKGLKSAIEYVYSLSLGTFTPTGPALKQEVYHFIRSEIIQAKKLHLEHPLENILSTLMQMFEKAEDLPKLSSKEFGSLEVIIWEELFQERSLLKKLPSYLREILSNELANTFIEHTDLPFNEIVEKTLSSLKKLRSIETTNLSKKVYMWSVQGDLIASLLHFDDQSLITRSIEKVLQEKSAKDFTHTEKEITEVVQKRILQTKPILKSWQPFLLVRIQVLYKFFWYNKLRKSSESSFDRFLKWHYNEIFHQNEQIFPAIYETHLEKICESSLPLTPFLPSRVRSMQQKHEDFQAS